jgi:hypothetical protein
MHLYIAHTTFGVAIYTTHFQSFHILHVHLRSNVFVEVIKIVT